MAESVREWPAGFDYVVWGVPQHASVPRFSSPLRWILVGAVVLAAAVHAFLGMSAAGFAGYFTLWNVLVLLGLFGLVLFFGFSRIRQEQMRTYDDAVQGVCQAATKHGRQGLEVTPTHLDDVLYRLNGFLSESQAYLREKIKELRSRERSVMWRIGIVAAMIFGYGGFLAAMAIDYYILSEFWASTYANEFGEVPEAFRNSVIFKSAQVAVAALAFHFFWKAVSRTVQKAFVVIIFVLTVVLLLGLGLFQAMGTIPAEVEVRCVLFGEDGVELVVEESSPELEDNVLVELGLAAPSEVDEEAGETLETLCDPATSVSWATFQAIIWYASFALIFVVVTGVAVMTLNFALRAGNALFGYVDEEDYHATRRNLRNVKLRLDQYEKLRENLMNPTFRKNLLYAALAQYREDYMTAVAEHGGAKGDQLQARSTALDEAIVATREKWTEDFIADLILRDTEDQDGRAQAPAVP